MFRLAFQFDRALVDRVSKLPYASFDREGTKTWTVAACEQTLQALRRLHYEGLLDVEPDTLLAPGETLEPVRPASLRRGTAKRPFVAQMAMRDDRIYQKLISVAGARWEPKAHSVSFPEQAASALVELIERGVLADPEGVLQVSGVAITFDTRTGWFQVRGDDRASRSFAKNFPTKDVVGAWQAKGLDVGFTDSFTEEMYVGELARAGPGIQPLGMQVELFGYQQIDVAVAVARTGLGIWSSMGVGKTPLAIAAAHEVMNNRRQVTRTVVVVPPALRTQWRNEIVRFTGCDPDDVVVIDGDKKKRLALYDQARDKPWLVVHYQAVILPDDTKALNKLVAGAYLVLDEAHRVKNETVKTHKVIKKFCGAAARRLLLSGTPVENNPGEWFNLHNLVYPGVFGSPLDFLNHYSYPGRFGGFEGARNIPELRERSKPLYVRRRLEDVADHLPRQRVETIVLEPRPEYAGALKRAHQQARDEIAGARVAEAEKISRKKGKVLDGYDREEAEAGADMTAVGMLKLMCVSPRIVAESESDAAEVLKLAGIVPDEDGPKLDELRIMAAEMQANSERLVAFTSSKRMANLISQRLEEDGIRHVLYTGDTNRAERDAAVAAFTTPATVDDPGPTMFVATDAGAEGLNLGRCCSTLVNLDIPWTPGRLAQRNARVRRVDSTASSFLVVNLVLAGTLELGILRMVEQKADLADAVMGESGGRAATTGRRGRNVFESAMAEWSGANT